MKISTKYHGDVEINPNEVISFHKGIPGFPEEKEFIVLPLSDDNFFCIMQSLTISSVAFVITNPFNFFKEYDFKLEESDVKELELKSLDDVSVYSILTVEDPFEKTTANLQAPVIINTTNNKAKQVILVDEEYKTKHNVFGKAELHKVKG